MVDESDLSANTVNGQASLQELQQRCSGSEVTLGPLCAIKHDERNTILVYDSSKRPPNTSTELRQTVDGEAIAPPGKALVCQGEALVTGQKIVLAGFR